MWPSTGYSLISGTTGFFPSKFKITNDSHTSKLLPTATVTPNPVSRQLTSHELQADPQTGRLSECGRDTQRLCSRSVLSQECFQTQQAQDTHTHWPRARLPTTKDGSRQPSAPGESVDRPEQKDQTVNQSPQLSSSEISSLTRLNWSSTASSLLNNPITGFLQKHSQQCLLSAHSLLIKPKAWRCLKEVDRISRLWQLPVLWGCRRRAACVLRQLVYRPASGSVMSLRPH